MSKDIIKIIKILFLFLFFVKFTIFLYITNFEKYYCSANSCRRIFIRDIIDDSNKLKEINILLLGDSRLNCAVNNNKIPKSYMFASGGASPIEMYYILEKFLKKHNKPDTVILSFSPRAIMYIMTFWDLQIKNDFFSYNDFQEINKISKKTDNHKTLLNYYLAKAGRPKKKDKRKINTLPYIKYLTYKLKYIGYYQSEIRENIIFGAKTRFNNQIKSFNENKGREIYRHLKKMCNKPAFETAFNDFKYSELCNYYLNEILKLCQKEKIFIRNETMPFNKVSEKKLSKTFLQNYKKYIRNLSAEYPEFEISDTIHFYPNDCFGDASHLNTKGMNRFTEYFTGSF